MKILRTLVLAAWTLGIVALGGDAPAQVTVVVDPYAGVDWSATPRHKAALHTHTTQSDGQMTPHDVIDEYHRRGYTILSLTDHNWCTWPWTELATLPRHGRAETSDRYQAGQEKVAPDKAPLLVPPYENRDPNQLGMLAIPGNELSRHHHTNALFVPFETESTDLDQSIAEVKAAGGLMFLNHPGRYWKPTENGNVPQEALDGYVARLTDEQNDHILGIELINQGYRYPQDRELLWDAILAQTMPDRPVWGFANDDMHSINILGSNWNTMLLSTLDEAGLRDAMTRGRFYFSTVTTHPNDQRDPEKTPVIESIAHDASAGKITIEATVAGEPVDPDVIAWISNGAVMHRGATLCYRDMDTLGSYVRAEITGPGGTTFTNPFGLSSNK